MVSSSNGNTTCSVARFNESGTAVLLTSCDVKPKWTNSFHAPTPNCSMASLTKYSTAFTSWLVMRSLSFTHWASASENVR